MVKIEDDFLIIENGSGIEMSGLCLKGVKLINCEYCSIANCEVTHDGAEIRRGR